MKLTAALAAAATLLILASPLQAASRGPLERQALWYAHHGGVYGHCYGCDTQRMKALIDRLIMLKFSPAGPSAIRTALCIARRESGRNPAADSPSDDHGVFQVNRPSHPQYNYALMDWDPGYSVEAGWEVSNHGTYWQPWAGGTYPCW